jgi:hypothetical protein
MCSTCASLDTSPATPFAEKMASILNSGALSLMISIGHRTGLFDVMAGREPSTSDQLAQAAKLNERYVREWLGALTAGGIDGHADPALNTTHPVGAFLYTISGTHCMTVSLSGNGAGLGAMWGVETAARVS